jgi:hypothetical protein
MKTILTFLKQKWIEIVITAIVFQLLTTALSISLGNEPWVIALTAIGLFAVIILFVVGYDLISKARKPTIVGDLSLGQIPRRGIIFTVGLKSHEPKSPLLRILDSLKPEYVGFLGSTGTEETIRTIIQKRDLSEDHYDTKLASPTNVTEIRDDTEHLIRWLMEKGLTAQEIVVDLTGGTAIMSIGAYIASVAQGVASQYMYSQMARLDRVYIGQKQNASFHRL